MATLITIGSGFDHIAWITHATRGVAYGIGQTYVASYDVKPFRPNEAPLAYLRTSSV